MGVKDFFLKSITLGFGFIIVVLLPLIFISQYDNLDKGTSENHNIVSTQTKSLYDSLDLLFIGNSYCYNSIDTEYLDSLNISSFNLGVAAAGVEFYDLLINDYFENTKTPPKKILLLVSPMTFSSVSDNFINYPIHRYLENEISNLEIATRNDKIDELISMTTKSIEKAFVNIATIPWNHNKKRFNHKGFFPSDEIVDEATISRSEQKYLSYKNEDFNKSQVEDLLKIANSVEQKGSEVIFFEVPTNLLSNYLSNDYLYDYKKSLEHISDNYELVSIDKNIFNSNNYRNIDHMNSLGARIATKEIVKLIE
ncbi:MAG: hypothetical protein ACJASR_001268 [Psychroserpens sp.]|jgi:hypothetical protein